VHSAKETRETLALQVINNLPGFIIFMKFERPVYLYVTTSLAAPLCAFGCERRHDATLKIYLLILAPPKIRYGKGLLALLPVYPCLKSIQ
jgi:hypothetical protein